jgi:PP-loop superfamily ATP-utilizing enzyme
MSEWSEVARQYISLAAPYIVPPIALLFATFLFKFILANRKTRQYAKMLMNVLQGQLEASIGAEKSKQVLELWNDIVKETEQNANSKSKTYSEKYFVTRMKNEVALSEDEEREISKILATMRRRRGKDGEVGAASDDEDNYKLPVLPCLCEL